MKNIPHIIHYCWFGRNPIPADIKYYIDGWKAKMTTWEFMCWNEDNFNLESSIPYVKEAYAEKKYAFVSDYVRLLALYNYGGVYLDTDVEIIKDFSKLLDDGNVNLVAAFESNDLIMTAFIASSRKNEIIKKLIDLYDNAHFVGDNGAFDELPNTVRFTDTLIQYGIKLGNSEQVINGGQAHIYTDEYFSGYNMENSHPLVTNNTYTIHHFQGSWKKMDLKTFVKYKVVVATIQKLIGYDNYDKLKAKFKL